LQAELAKAPKQADLDAATKQVGALQAELAKGPKQADLDAATKQVGALQAELTKAPKQADLDAAAKQVGGLQAELAKAPKQADLDAATKQVGALQAALAGANQQIAAVQNKIPELTRQPFNPKQNTKSFFVTPSAKFWWEDDLCRKYLQYTPRNWDRQFDRSSDPGTSMILVSSLELGATLETAKEYANRFKRSFPTIDFYPWFSKNGSNSRWAVALAKGIEDGALLQNTLRFAKGCVDRSAFIPHS
jgi:hypothetical protein